MNDYSNLYEQYLAGTKAQAMAGLDANPDEAARSVQLASATGVPAPVIDADQEGFQTRHQRSLLGQMLDNNPSLRDYVNSNPMAAKVSNDDWGTLDSLSRGLQTTRKFLESLNPGYKVVEGAMTGAAEGAREAFGTEPLWPENEGTVIDRLPVLGKTIAGGVEANLLATGINIGNLLNRGLGAMFAGTTRAVGSAVETGAKAVGVDPTTAAAMGREATAIQEYRYIEPMPGHPWTLAGHEPPAGSHPEIDKIKVQVNQAGIDQLESHAPDIAASTTAARSPEIFSDFMEQHLGQRTIGISSDAVRALYGDKAPEPGDGLLGFVPDLSRQLADTAATGGDIAVPLKDWLVGATPELKQAVRDDVRIWPGGITAREAAVEPAEPKPPAPGFDPDTEAVRQTIGADTSSVVARAQRLQEQLPVDTSATTNQALLEHIKQAYDRVLVADKAADRIGPQGVMVRVEDVVREAGITPEQFHEIVNAAPSRYAADGSHFELLGSTSAKGKRSLKVAGTDYYNMSFDPEGHPRHPGPRSLGAAESGEPSAFPAMDQIKPEVAGLTAPIQEKLAVQIEERRAADYQAALDRATREVKREQSEDWATKTAEMQPEVEAAVRARPDVAADLFFGAGELEGNKIRQRFTIAEDAVPDNIKEVLPKHYLSKNGIDPDEAAPLFGYSSGPELLDALARHNAMKGGRTPREMFTDMVKAETDVRMREKYGDLPQNILEEARDRALADTELHLMADETYAAGLRSGVNKPVDLNAVKAEAAAAVGRMSTAEINSTQMLGVVGKHARDADRAGITGDWATAYTLMQRRINAMAQAKEMVKVEKELRTFGAMAKQLAKREVKSVAPEYMNYIHQSLQKVGLRADRSPQSLVEDIEARGTGSLEEFVEAKTSAYREMPVWPPLFDEGWKKDFKALSVDEFRAFRDSITALRHNGREELKIYRANEAADFASTKAEMIGALDRFKDIPTDTKGRQLGIGRYTAPLRRFVYAHLIPETILNRWDRFDPKGVWNQYVMRDLIGSANDESAMQKEFAGKLADAADDGVDLKETIPNQIWKNPRTGNLFRMDRGNLRTILLNVGNSAGIKSNLWKMASGYKLTPEAVMEWVHTYATKADWDFAQKVWDMFDDLKDRSDTMYRSLTGGVAPDHVRVDPIQTPFGEYRGGYYPVIWHPEFEQASAKLKGRAPLEDETYVRATTPAGYTKTRSGYSGPMALDLDYLPGRITQQIHDIAMRPAIINASKVFYDNDIRAAIARTQGAEVRDLFIPYLRDVANSMNYMSKAQSDFKRWSEFIRTNMISTLVGLNPGTVLKHGLTAWVQSMHEVGAERYLRAVRGLFSVDEHSSETNWSFAMRYSTELQRRQRNYMETLTGVTAEMAPETPLAGLRQTMLKVASTPVARSDLISAVPTWLAKYEEAMEDGEDHGQAVYLADRAVRRAHGSTAITNRPGVMRDWNPWLTSVYSFFNHIMNRQAEMVWKAGDMLGEIRGGDREAAMARVPEITGMLFSYVVFPALVEQAVVNTLSPSKSEQKESWGGWAAKGIGFTLGSSWVIARDVASALFNGTDPSVGLASTALKTITDVGRDLFEKHEPFSRAHAAKLVQDGSALVGLGTGMPLQIGRTARFATGIGLGVEHPRGPWDWLRGAVHGTLKERR